MQERLGQAQVLAVAHRAAHDLAQHVAASFVRRDDAVGDEERRRARVIADDARRRVELVVHVAAVAVAADARRCASRIALNESMSYTVGTPCRTLVRRSRPAPVSTDGAGSGVSVPSAVAVVLHEHDVPDLHRVVAGSLTSSGTFFDMSSPRK